MKPEVLALVSVAEIDSGFSTVLGQGVEEGLIDASKTYVASFDPDSECSKWTISETQDEPSMNSHMDIMIVKGSDLIEAYERYEPPQLR